MPETNDRHLWRFWYSQEHWDAKAGTAKFANMVTLSGVGHQYTVMFSKNREAGELEKVEADYRSGYPDAILVGEARFADVYTKQNR